MKGKFWAILMLAILIIVSVTIVTQSFQTKYFFSRDECRYIFKQGSCVVDNQFCDLNSHAYKEIVLDPRTHCISEIVYTEGYSEKDIELVSESETLDLAIDENNCAFVVREKDFVRIRGVAVDPDKNIGPAEKLLWTFFAPFNQEGEWQTKVGDAGIHSSKIQVSDGELTDSKAFCINVLKAKVEPILTYVKNIIVNEGETIILDVKCIVDEGLEPVISFDGWMTSSTKETSREDVGDHKVMVTCEDGDEGSVSEEINIVVNRVNRAPMLSVTGASVYEGETAKLDIIAEDPDGDELEIVIDYPFDEDGVWVTREGDAGMHIVTVEVSDGIDTVSKEVEVEIKKVNRAPMIENFGDITVYETETVEFNPTITDEDGDELNIDYSGWMTSRIKKTDYGDAGTYQVTLSVSDGKAITSKTVNVTVLPKNRAPVITKVIMEEPEYQELSFE